MKECKNCAYFEWQEKKMPIPSACMTCTAAHVPNGESTAPSNWKAKPVTNGDRIRAMSDEELAAMFCGLCDSIEICSRCPAQNDCPGTSVAAWTAWLQKEAD